MANVRKDMSDTYPYDFDDPEMSEAIKEARQRLPELRRALENDSRRIIPVVHQALVKARFVSKLTGANEHMWIEVIEFKGDNVLGTLANEPENIPELKTGEEVLVEYDQISDWAYREGDNTVGGFTVKVMQSRGQEI